MPASSNPAAPQDAGIAGAASQSFRRRIVAAVRQGKIHARLNPGSDDLGLAHMQQRRMNAIPGRPFDSGLGRKIGELFKSLQKFRPAVRIPGIIDGVDPDENILRFENFAPAEGEAEKNRVARRHIGDGNFGGNPDRLSLFFGTSISAVRAEPPNIRRSILATMWWVMPSDCATRRAASSSHR